MIVADANLVGALWAGGPPATVAEAVRHRDPRWVATTGVLALALRSGCPAYDREYVALAEGLDVPLVTFDREVLRAFPNRAITPQAFLRD